MSLFELTDSFRVPADIDKTWEFFSNAENLERITPASLGFTIATPRPIVVQQDAVLDYTIRALGIPMRWRTLIVDWSPKRQFIDLQTRGPYSLWHHQHRFEPVACGTNCFDRVLYRLPMAFLGTAVHALVVRRQLMKIFRYRRQVIAQFLGVIDPLQPDVLIRRIG
jgi:uncharacterized protein